MFRLATTLISLFIFAEVPIAAAQEVMQWSVRNHITGKHGKPSEDISGIACSTSAGFPRRCLVIDDNLQAAQQVTLSDGLLEAGDFVPLIDNAWMGKPLELDGEGVAYADGVFYVIGSHGHTRDKDQKLDPVADRDLIAARIAAASQIVPLRVEPDGTLARLPLLTLTDAIAAEAALRLFAGKRLEANGLTIEGIAVKGDSLFAGFRGPGLRGDRAAVLRVSIAMLRGGTGPTSHLFRLPLGEGQGVRDMAPYREGFLVLAGPIMDVAGSYQLFLWDGASDEGVRTLGDITTITSASKTRKPEGILLLSSDERTIRVLIFSDGAKEGEPTALTIELP